MKLKRKLAALLFAAILTTLLPTTALAASFSDVPSTHWAYKNIEEMVADGVTAGTGDGKFSPNGTLTYAQYTVMMVRAFYQSEFEADRYVSIQNKSDVTQYIKDSVRGQWYEKHLSLAYDKGFVVHPEFALDAKPCTRLMMADMMYRIMQDKGVQIDRVKMETARDSIKDWGDIAIKSPSYTNAVLACYSTGLIEGNTDGTFGGHNTLNRAQAAAIYCRLKNLLNTPQNTQPTQQPTQSPVQSAPETTKPVETTQPEVKPEVTPETPTLSVPESKPENNFPEGVSLAGSTWAKLSDGSPATEASVSAKLRELERMLPSGSYFDTESNKDTVNGGNVGGRGCVKWANVVGNYVFGGTAKWKTTTGSDIDIWSIKPGDRLQFPNHTSIALGRVEEHSFPDVGIVSYTVPTTDSSNDSYTVDWNFSTDGGHVIASNSNGSFSVRLISHTTYY